MITIETTTGNILFVNENEVTHIIYNKRMAKVVVNFKDTDNLTWWDVKSVSYNGSMGTNEKAPIDLDELKKKSLVDLDIDVPGSWVRFLNACKSEDIMTVGELLKNSPSYIATFRNCGYTTVERIRKALKEKYNLDW